MEGSAKSGNPAPPSGTAARSLLDLIIETAPDAIITINAEGRILSFSPAAERMFGYDEAEVLGRNVSCLMPEPHRAQHDGYIARYLATGEKRIIGIGREVKALRKGGEVFPAELAVGELFDGTEHIFTGFVRDASDRTAALARAKRLQRKLDQVSRFRMVGEMSTALSHELNQPLAAISNFARAAARSLAAGDAAKATDSLDRIAEQAQRAGEILKRMRRFVDHGRIEVQADDINDIVREAVRLNHYTIADERVRVVMELGHELPPVRADRIQIQQVIMNLLKNAQEAILEQEGGDVHISTGVVTPAGEIRLHAQAIENEVIVTISDTGRGVPEGMLERMFEPLTTTKPSGLGVGLAVSQSIIRAHGGRIWARNRPDGGAEFHFTLPVADE